MLFGVGGFNVGSGGLEGVQAVIRMRSAKNDKSFVAWQVFILRIIPTEEP
jgi:hypothetical protein